MKSTLTKLFDRSQLTIPEEMTKWRVSPEELAEQLNTLARVHAREFQPDTVQSGDGVRLSCPGRMDVLLFPGLAMPGAQEAEQAVVGLHVGDPLTAPINGVQQTMTVCEIRRRAPADIDDALVQAEHIEGVATVEDYRRWYQADAEEQNRLNATKSIAFFMLEELRDRSEYDLDPEELDAWTGQRARICFDEYLAMGQDPRIPDEGVELLTDEQAIEKIKAQVIPDYKALILCQLLCDQNGISTAWEDLRSEFEQYNLADMSEEELEKIKAIFLENAPITKTFGLLREEAEHYLED